MSYEPHICEQCGSSFEELEFTYGHLEFCSEFCMDQFIQDCEWQDEDEDWEED